MSEEGSVKLSPPWYTFFNYLKHSIGKDQCVDVLDMEEISEGDFLIPVEVRDRGKAIALATILVPCKNFGNINVRIKVLYCGRAVKPYCHPHDVSVLIKIFEEALETNYYFEYVESGVLFGSTIVFPVFKREVIQFFNDDLSDLYSNFNGVAAMVFAEVLESRLNDVSIRPSTVNR